MRRRPVVNRLARGCTAPFRLAFSGAPMGYVFVVLTVLYSLLYWLGASCQEPDTRLAVHAMYRPDGDIAYFPYIRLYGDGRFTEGLVLEKEGSGVLSFPILALLPHAVLFRWFGAAGFILADPLFAALYYLLLAGLLRACRVRPWLAAAVAFAVAMHAGVNVRLQVWRLVASLMPFNILWDPRLPRPYVTEPLALAVLLCLLGVVCRPGWRRDYRIWVLTGAAEAVLAQGDMHTAIVLLMSVAAAGAWLLATSRGERLQVAGRLFVFGVTLTGLCVPFLMQRLLEHPDVPRRFGVFPVSPATAVGFLLETGDLGSTLGAMAALLATGGLLWASDATEAAAARARAMAAWAGILACSCAALPMSALLLGRAIQPYHFEMSRAVLTRYGLVVALTYLVQRLLDVLRAGEPLGGVRALVARRAGAVVALFLCLLGAKGFALAARDSFCRTNQGHVRADLSEYRSLPDYRRNFKALVSELEKPAYGRCRVLATFDHQVFAWWTSFRRGYAFNPDPFSSAVCDAEIERRLLLFCKALRMTPDDFGSFLDRPNVNLLWLGCAKYQASRAHTFAPMGEYTERQREQILRSSLQDSWTLVVPQAEKARLARLYADVAAVSEMPRLDVMILTNDESLRSFAPSAGEYEEVYRNAAFRVFLNRGSVVQARRRGPAASGRVSG